jgi:hypothetical protein
MKLVFVATLLAVHAVGTCSFMQSFFRSFFGPPSLNHRYRRSMYDLRQASREYEALQKTMNEKQGELFESVVMVTKYVLSPDGFVAIRDGLGSFKKRLRNGRMREIFAKDTADAIQSAADWMYKAARVCAKFSVVEADLNEILSEAMMVDDSNVLEDFMDIRGKEHLATLPSFVELHVQ